MNYYEELGLTPEATAEDIHRAHRKLTKLMHPDVQTDEGMRRLAETQMRRLNTIVDTLTDEGKRKQYDKEIKPPTIERPMPAAAFTVPLAAEVAPSNARMALHRVWRLLPWWVWSSAGALVLTSAGVYFWADSLGSSFGNKSMEYVPTPDTPPAAQTGGAEGRPARPTPKTPATELADLSAKLRSVFESRQSAAKAPANPANEAKPQNAKDQTEPLTGALPEPPVPKAPPNIPTAKPAPHTEAADLARLTPPKIEAPLPTAAPPVVGTPVGAGVNAPVAVNSPASSAGKSPAANAPSNSGSNTAAANSKPAAVASSAATGSASPGIEKTPARVPPATDSGFRLEGEWVYSPPKPEPHKPGLFPPDFIEMRIYRSSGELRGNYHARYQVDNRPIDPDVVFNLSSIDSDKKFRWVSPNGSKGTMKIKRLTDSSIKIEWETVIFSKARVLTSGIATLNKR